MDIDALGICRLVVINNPHCVCNTMCIIFQCIFWDMHCIGHIFYNMWASLIVQLVKNSPAMQETPVQLLGWEDLLEKG